MLERGSHKEALDNFELALQIDPKHRVRLLVMSQSHFNQLAIVLQSVVGRRRKSYPSLV